MSMFGAKREQRLRELEEQLASARADLAAERARVALLVPQLEEMRRERSALLDRFMIASGFQPLYEKLAPTMPGEPVPMVERVSDYCAAATELENKAFERDRLELGHDVIASMHAPDNGRGV